MSAAFETQTLADEVKPLKVANRDAYVFPSYRRRMGEHANERAVVTQNGQPIVRNNETLLLGMVPMERRYAIGPVQDGKAEILPQHLFAEEHERVYVAEYGMRGQAPDNVKWRYVPDVAEFVAWKIDPTNPNRITTLGFVPAATAAAPTPEALPQEIETLRAEKDAQALQLDEMQRKLDALAAMMANQPVKVIEERPASAMETAPCGKDIKAGFLKQHQNFCKKPECAGE